MKIEMDMVKHAAGYFKAALRAYLKWR